MSLFYQSRAFKPHYFRAFYIHLQSCWLERNKAICRSRELLFCWALSERFLSVVSL